MGYTNETTHYGIPLPLGSDLTTPMDYNTAAEAVDAAVFEAVSNSSGAVDTAAEAVQTANAAATTAAGAVTEAQTAHAVADAATTAAGTAQNTANAAQIAVDNLESQTRTIAQVTADGVKTRTQLLNELYTAAKPALVQDEKVLFEIGAGFMLGSYNATTDKITASSANLASDDSFAFIDVYTLATSGSSRKRASLTFATNEITFIDMSATPEGAGVVYKLVEFN